MPMSVANTTKAQALERRSRFHLSTSTREAIDAYVFMSPAILGLLIFFLGPMVVSFYLSFTEYDLLLGTANWIGLENYREMFADELFWKSLRVSAIYSF